MPSKRKLPKLIPHDPSKTLRDADVVLTAFVECLAEGDTEAAREILAASLRHLNKAELARKYKIPRRTAYNLMDRKSVPSLDLVAKVCRAIRNESAR